MEYICKEEILQTYEEQFNSLDIQNREVYRIPNKINELSTMTITTCNDCRFHMDCNIEKILPGEMDKKFCSYGKTKI